MTIKLSSDIGKNFCIAPWVNLHINTQGQFKPCCGGGKNFGNVSDDWSYINQTNDELNLLKEELLTGRQPKFCQGCQERDWYSEYLSKNVQFDDPKKFRLMSLDMRWNTTCQLSCVYCNHLFSSTWQKLEHNYKKIPIQNSRPYHSNYPQLFKFIEQNQETLERVSLLGGEPLLIKENLQLLELLSDKVSIEIFTNLNVDIEDNQIFRTLASRSNVKWYISMETTGVRFEYVRRGADWNKQCHNLSWAKQYLPEQHVFDLHAQFCVYSAFDLVNLYDYFAPCNQFINWAFLQHPEELNILLFPKSIKENILIVVDQLMSKYEIAQRGLGPVRQSLIDNMEKEKNEIVQKCRKWNHQIEQRYFNNRFEFDYLWPELKRYQKNSP